MSKETPANYTAAQVAILVALAAAQPDGKLSLETVKPLENDPRMNTADGKSRNYRSILAKINREGIPYRGKVAVSKTGEPVVKKSDLVARIAAIVSGNMEGLDKAPKAALVAIASFVEGAAEAETVEGSEAANG